jgi:hypothetical protein
VRARRSARRALLGLALPLLLVLAGPVAPVRAATFSFSGPHTTSVFNQGIDFTIQMTASQAPSRVELQLLFPGAIGPLVVALPDTPTSGTSTLHYTLDTSGSGHIMPNTPVTSSWVAYPQGGGTPVSSTPSTYRYTDETQDWQTLRDGIVTVHWTQGSQAFAQRAAAVAVKAISTDAKLLGVQETKPVDFFIYADDTGFRAALGPGARENVGGTAITNIRTLFAEFTPDILNNAWVGITITHELTHQVVDDATDNPYRSLPRWLNEGFAVYQSEGNTASYRSRLQSAIASGDLLPLTALGWQFPTDPTKTVLGYAESVSAVDYIARQYGTDALVKLILAYKSGPTDDEALQAAIGEDMAAFQDEWYKAIGATTPSKFGPRPAPSGPLPPDWTAGAASPAPPASAVPTAAAAGTAPPAASAPPEAAATAAPGPSAGGGSSDDLTLVLVAIIVVAGAVLAGLVVAGRRAASP